IDESIDYQASLKPFNQLKERWKKSGPIPRDQYNIVWNDYHFHLERFYDQLHLDREARDKEFQLNLEYKQRLIRSEEHTSELQSREKLVCRLLLEKKNTKDK